jgi:hypothetical protein
LLPGPVKYERAIFYVLLSAALFGVSTPAAKVFLVSAAPAVLAGLLYCRSGLGVAVVRRFPRPVIRSAGAGEAALGRRDLPWLCGAIAAGGVVAGACLFLTRTDAAAALLLPTL